MELILFAMISLIVIVALLASRLNDNSFPFPFDKKETIFTPAEKNFQNLVEQAMGDKYRIINRVKLSDMQNNFKDYTDEVTVEYKESLIKCNLNIKKEIYKKINVLI